MGHYQDDYDAENRAVYDKRFSACDSVPHAAPAISPAKTHVFIPQMQIVPAVGDVNSSAKGTGARYNADKTPYDMLPIQLLLDWLTEQRAYVGRMADEGSAAEVLSHLGRWQAGDDLGLDNALAASLPRYQCTSLDQFAEAARVFQHVTTRPVKPYPKWNWMKGMAWSVPLGCAIRHLLALQSGEELDPETGITHWGHVQCNLIMLLHYRHAYPQGDDRPSSEWY